MNDIPSTERTGRLARAKPRWRSWRPPRSSAHQRIALVVLAIVLLGLGLILGGLEFTDPHPVSVVALDTELVSVQVVDARKSAFNIAGTRLGPIGQPAGPCMTGLVTPALGATVTFARTALDPLEITIDPPSSGEIAATLDRSDGSPPQVLSGPMALIADKACDSPAAQRFPIWGYVQIGREYRPATDTDAPEPFFLLGGTIQIAAHAILTHTLYQVATIALPAGGRLQTTRPGSADQNAVWWGALSLDPFRQALLLNAATESPTLYMYRPNQTDAESVEIWGWMRIRSDPMIETIAVLFGACSFLYGSLVFFYNFVKDRLNEGAK